MTRCDAGRCPGAASMRSRLGSILRGGVRRGVEQGPCGWERLQGGARGVWLREDVLRPSGWRTVPGKLGFATSEVQISETETPLHRLETVYRRLNERLATADTPQGALRNIVDGWFFTLEEDVLAEGTIDPNDAAALLAADQRTARAATRRRSPDSAPTFSAALRGYRRAQVEGRQRPRGRASSPGLRASRTWPRRRSGAAGVKGDIDHFGALNFLQGILTILRDSGHVGPAGRARRGRDDSAGPERRAGQEPERAPAAH